MYRRRPPHTAKDRTAEIHEGDSFNKVKFYVYAKKNSVSS